MELLEQINFNDNDTLYVLGDITDRGEFTLECMEYIYSAPNIICLMGNHEDMMLKYFPGSGRKRNPHWLTQGGDKPLNQIMKAKRKPESKARWDELLNWVRSLPLYIEVMVNGKLFFLSHAGLNIQKHNYSDLESLLMLQEPRDFFWSRQDFFTNPGLENHHCIFGHTTTYSIRGNNDCSIWVDPVHKDKTCIDGGCVYGGALAALRLDDEAMFHVKSRKKRDKPEQLFIGEGGKYL